MRDLGSERVIVRRSYLPDTKTPRIRFVAPPCQPGQPPRNLVFSLESATMTWVAAEPFMEIGTWYQRGFEDPKTSNLADGAVATIGEFTEVQNELGQQFERLQQDIGLPTAIPSPSVLSCS